MGFCGGFYFCFCLFVCLIDLVVFVCLFLGFGFLFFFFEPNNVTRKNRQTSVQARFFWQQTSKLNVN